MAVRLDIISIGTLERNLLWGEGQPVRTPHATTTLIRAGKQNILVDPGLPPAAIAARLFERTGMKPEQINIVFLTNFRPDHRAGLTAFTKAKVLIHEVEQQSMAQQMQRMIASSHEQDEDRTYLERELALLESMSAAGDTLGEGVDLFPLFGYTPGNCGLLVTPPTSTTLIAGGAVPTMDHFLAGQVLPDAFDIKATQESMAEVYEIADLVVPSHDNIFLNPRAQGM